MLHKGKLCASQSAARIGGKPKGEGMDHAGQLKALKEDLWKSES